jgi:hypothetical protein
MMISDRAIEMLGDVSLFLYVATLADIDQERQRMEMLHEQDLLVHEVSYPTRSGACCTRVTWQCLR